jgi:2-polyprenyl-3-methyl-5-hydroxy-6-metoxy-1,4-benzoquinol methylase
MPPSSLVTELEPILPKKGRALDLAGGRGRHALWLARLGLDVTLVDVSGVGLELARQAAESAGVKLETEQRDLEAAPFPAGPWDLILCFHYLQPSLFTAFPEALAPGGLLIFVQPTMKNLERHTRPSARFLLQEGELRGLVQGLEILRYDEGWLQEDRHEARVVARRKP